MKGHNRFKATPDNHDFMEPDHIARFLRNHKTGTDNFGRHALAEIVKQFHAGSTVLDAACGTCVNWEVFKMRGVPCSYTGMDRSKDLLAHAKQLYGDEIDTQEGYVQEMPFKDAAFDIVILRHILEHLQEGYEAAITEGLRVAKKELIIIFFVDPVNTNEDTIKESEPDEHNCTYFWNTYSWPKLMNFLVQFGYKIETGVVETPGAAARDTIVRIIK